MQIDRACLYTASFAELMTSLSSLLYSIEKLSINENVIPLFHQNNLTSATF